MAGYINLLKFRLIWLNVILGFLFLVLAFFNSGFVPLFYLFTTNLFDALGYYIVLRRMWAEKTVVFGNEFKLVFNLGELESDIILPAYRVIQFMFDFTLFVLIAIVFGLKPAIGGYVTKLFGAQDVLFYLVLKVKLPEKWTWLEWSVFGRLIRGGELKNWIVIVQAIIGVILGILIAVI